MAQTVSNESNAPKVQIPAIVFLIVCPVIIGLRIWGRIRSKNKLGPDDWTILASFVFSAVVSILMLECKS
jgi:hypothetical protein